ncbi:MAG: iron-containing alcohol dehydrogenase [bacterium]
MFPSFYEFHCPVKIVCGHKALQNLPHELEQLGARRALIVTDAGVAEAGLLGRVTDVFAGSRCEVGAVYDQTPADSSHRVVNELAALYRRERCDSIVAVGGGSPIDTAKGVNILVSQDAEDLIRFEGIDRLTRPARPLIVVPTTSGTGSEVTSAAVITNADTGVKMPFMDNRLSPHVALLDPVMTVTLPPRITAATGMDALTHAIEAYYCLGKNPVSDAFATAAIRLIWDNLLPCVENGGSEERRLAMANGAMLAGIAFSNSMVGVVHSLAHATGALCHVPHGVANSIFLPWGMESNLEKVGDVIAELAPLLGVTPLPVSKTGQATAAIQAVRGLTTRLNASCGLPTTLREAGVPEDKLEQISRAAINDGAVTCNPEDVTAADALAILRRAY